jgi:branched-chain amino acid transport system permease protein
MTETLLYLSLGVGTGAVYAAIALGLVLGFRGSGVVNYAAGAMAMYPAMVYVTLRQKGDLVLPWVVLPNRFSLGDEVAAGPAFLLAILVAAFIGLVSHLVIFQPLRNRPAVTKVIAAIGLTQVLQMLAVIQFGIDIIRPKNILPDNLVGVFGGSIPADRLWLAGLVMAMAGGLMLMYRYTRLGLATRAAAESEKGALLLGLSPGALAAMNWILAAVIAAIAGILITPIAGVNPFNYTFYVVPALAAALAGRLRSFPITALVGIAIGMFEGLAVHLKVGGSVPRVLESGFDSALPFLVIVVVLVVTGNTLPRRGTLVEAAQPYAPRAMRPSTLLTIAAVAMFFMLTAESGLRLALIQSLVITGLMLAMVVIAGLIGQVSLAEFAFAGTAAFLLARFGSQFGWPFPFAPLAAIATTTTIGVLVGFPAVRIRGVQLAVVTLAFAVAIEQLLFRNNDFVGPFGVAHAPPLEIFGVDFGVSGDNYPRKAFGAFVVVVVMLSVALVRNLRASNTGRRFLAVRANENAAAAAGVDVVRTKLLGAGLAAFLSSITGVLLGYLYVDYSAVGFESVRGLAILTLAYVGGIASVGGALIAGLITPSGVVTELTTSGSNVASYYQQLLTGLALIVVAVKLPGGLSQGFASWPRRARGLMARIRQSISSPPPPSSGGLEIESLEVEHH